MVKREWPVDVSGNPVDCNDGDVDLADFLIFQQHFTGSE